MSDYNYNEWKTDRLNKIKKEKEELQRQLNELQYEEDYLNRKNPYVSVIMKDLNLEEGDWFYVINSLGVDSIRVFPNPTTPEISNMVEIIKRSGAFLNKGYACYFSDLQTLMRDMDKFSKENGGLEIDWSDIEQVKYYLSYDERRKSIICSRSKVIRDFAVVYFKTKDVAERAIEVFGDRIKELHSMKY